MRSKKRCEPKREEKQRANGGGERERVREVRKVHKLGSKRGKDLPVSASLCVSGPLSDFLASGVNLC